MYLPSKDVLKASTTLYYDLEDLQDLRNSWNSRQ